MMRTQDLKRGDLVVLEDGPSAGRLAPGRRFLVLASGDERGRVRIVEATKAGLRHEGRRGFDLELPSATWRLEGRDGDNAAALERPAMSEEIPGLTVEEVAILRTIESEAAAGRPPHLPDTPARQRLRRLGLIQIGPFHPPGTKAFAGRGRRWHLTAAGRAKLEEAGS